MEKTVTQFLNALRTPVSKAYVQKLISSHPDFPSLLSISDVLNRLGITNVARRVKKEDLTQIGYPYLIPVGNDVLLINKEADLKKNETNLHYWNEVVLQAEPVTSIKDKLNNKLHAKERLLAKLLIALFVVLVLAFGLIFLSFFSITFLSLFTSAALGATVGYFLLAKELGVTYAAVDAFCNAGKNTNCDKVLKADLKLFGIGLPEVVVTFFVFQVLALSIAQVLPEIGRSYWLVLSVLSVLALPISAFSLYYQYFIAKSWCRLCLVVVAVLVAQFIVFSLSYFMGTFLRITAVPIINIVTLVLMFAGIGLAVLILKAILERANMMDRVGMYGNRVKHAIPVFTHLLSQEQQIDDTPLENELIIGDPTAPIKITMVTNLYCNPCKLKHEVLAELTEVYPTEVCAAMRFVQSGKDEETRNTTVPYLLDYWLTFIKGNKNEGLDTERFMHDWFEIWDLEKFKQKYPLGQNRSEVAIKIAELHYAWTNREAIHSTPTFFINGQKLPTEYGLEDLLIMLPELTSKPLELTKASVAQQEV